MRLPNDPVALAVVSQMASPGNVSDDQDVGFRLLRRPVQQLRDIAAIDDDFGLRAHVLLKLRRSPRRRSRRSSPSTPGRRGIRRGRRTPRWTVMWTSVSVASTAAAISAASDTVWRLCAFNSTEQRTRRIENSPAGASSR